MDPLNYHHLRYFREVAHEGNLTRVAARLNVSQSALSIQIKTLEARLGHALFERKGRSLVLTEVGRITLDHADRIFATGADLLATLNRASATRNALRVGALSTLSRNFQLSFIAPLLEKATAPVILRSGAMDMLIDELLARNLDVVLTTQPPDRRDDAQIAVTRIARQTVGLHGTPERMNHTALSTLLAHEPLILPNDPVIRGAFSALIDRLAVSPNIVAEADDMAMVRLLARRDFGVAIAPAIVLRDELESKKLMTAPFDLGIDEPFFAVTVPRKFPHHALAGLLNASADG